MPNISITRRCRRNCDYCFARHERANNKLADMPLETYEQVLSFLRRSGVSDVRLLGGEPTEHPQFAALAERALEEGFSLTVFTGGLVPVAAMTWLRQAPAEQVRVILNTAMPGLDAPALLKAQEELCRVLGSKVELGVNIRSVSMDLEVLLAQVERHNLQRRIRLGLAHPIPGGANTYLRTQWLQRLSPLLENFVSRAEAVGVELDWDCGFTPCMFSASFIASHEELFRSIGVRCNPIIDLLPEGQAISCYALSRFRHLPLTPTSTRTGLLEQFEQELETAMPLGVFKTCADCTYLLSGLCNGGCRARRALRLRPNAEAWLGGLAGGPP